MVSRMTDEDIWRLNGVGTTLTRSMRLRGGGEHKDQPTVILAKTIRATAWASRVRQRIRPTSSRRWTSHHPRDADRFNVPIHDDKLEELPLYKPRMMIRSWCIAGRRKALGGYFAAPPKGGRLPLRCRPSRLHQQLRGSEGRESRPRWRSRMLTGSCATRTSAGTSYIVPTKRHFRNGRDFRQSRSIPRKTEVRAGRPRAGEYYREDKAGADSRRGINEAGAFSSWIAAANFIQPFEPSDGAFYIFYSMFASNAWAISPGPGGSARAGVSPRRHGGPHDSECEGLQHETAQPRPSFRYSQLHFLTIRPLRMSSPSRQDGLRRMVNAAGGLFYYIHQ